MGRAGAEVEPHPPLPKTPPGFGRWTHCLASELNQSPTSWVTRAGHPSVPGSLVCKMGLITMTNLWGCFRDKCICMVPGRRHYSLLLLTVISNPPSSRGKRMLPVDVAGMTKQSPGLLKQGVCEPNRDAGTRSGPTTSRGFGTAGSHGTWPPAPSAARWTHPSPGKGISSTGSPQTWCKATVIQSRYLGPEAAAARNPRPIRSRS